MNRCFALFLWAAATLAAAAPINPCTLLKAPEVASALGVSAVSARRLTAPVLSMCEFRTGAERSLSVALLPAGQFPPGKSLAEVFRAQASDGLHRQITPIKGLGDDAVVMTTLQERKSLSTTVRAYTISLLVRKGGQVLQIGGAQVTAGVRLAPPFPNAQTLTGLARLALKRLP